MCVCVGGGGGGVESGGGRWRVCVWRGVGVEWRWEGVDELGGVGR